MPPIPPNILTCFKKNLSALEKVDSTLAGKIGDISWPEDLKFIPALDGTPTAFSRKFSRSGWYAFSSVPAVREKSVCDKFSPGSSNIILPGAGHGFGLKSILKRFDLSQSVYVWEPDFLLIAVLLSLHDLSDYLASRRLIFLTDQDLTKNLVDFVTSHLEITHPDKMMAWPWISENKMQEISLKVEHAVNEFSLIINKNAEILQERITQLLSEKSGNLVKNIGIISAHSHPRIHQLARDFHWAAEKLGFNAQIYVFDRPEHSSGIGILRYLIDSPPDLIISIGFEKKRWTVKIPSNIPFISVLMPPGISLGDKISEITEPAENEIYVLGSREDLLALEKKISPDKLFMIEIGVNPDNFCPLPQIPDMQIAIFADHPDPNPEKVGIAQDSHKFLWQKTEELIGKNPLGFSNLRAGAYVEKASEITRIKFSDQELANSFALCVKRFLGPSVLAEYVLNKLITAGLKVKVFGSGWEETRFADLAAPVSFNSETLNAIFDSSRLVMVLDNESNFRQIVIDALCAAKWVIVKNNPEDRIQKFPEINDNLIYLDPSIPLQDQVQNLFGNHPPRNDQIRNILSQNYNFSDILGRILEKMAIKMPE
jgi:hypothetical protein